MSLPLTFEIRRLGHDDLAAMDALLDVFGEAFEEAETYGAARPSRDYMRRLLASDTFVALAAMRDGAVIGGLAAYELPKFERERSEFYIYDLAVCASHRRLGIATALIAALRKIAAARGGWVVFVQADRGDAPAIAIYEKLGVREDVLHFDIAVD